jgi:hypothetical protein
MKILILTQQIDNIIICVVEEKILEKVVVLIKQEEDNKARWNLGR